MIIRRDQMAAFQHAAFLQWMECHIMAYFPAECARIESDSRSQTIAAGIARANTYGFVAPEDICQFVDLLFALHPEFDNDEALPWARRLLNDPTIVEPAVRLDLLVDTARDYLRGVAVN